jgi:hypothetical protein
VTAQSGPAGQPPRLSRTASQIRGELLRSDQQRIGVRTVAKTKPNSKKAGQQGPLAPPGGKPLKGVKGGGSGPHVQRIQKPKAK